MLVFIVSKGYAKIRYVEAAKPEAKSCWSKVA